MAIGINDYPYAGSPFGGSDPANGLTGNRWATRQCTSFVAWRMLHDFGFRIPWTGDAKDWIRNARAMGFAVDGTPRPNDIMVDPPGVNHAFSSGHVAFVMHLNGASNTVHVEQYNFCNECGLYSQGDPDIRGAYFIHAVSAPTPTPPSQPPPHPPYGNLPLPGQGTTIGAPAAPQSPAAANSTAGSEALGLLLLAGGGAGLWYAARRRGSRMATVQPRNPVPLAHAAAGFTRRR